MPESRTPRAARGLRRRRGIAALAAAVALGAVLVPRGALADPPPNPSDQQIQNARNEKQALADQVGRLSARVAQLQSQLGQLEARKELAEQKVAYALQKLADAKTAAEQARRDVQTAQGKVVQAQQDFVGYVQASYMNGDVQGTTGTLLTANDPSVMLEQSTLREYQASHQISAIGNLQRATVAKSNADAAARRAVQTQQQLTDAAKAAQEAAVRAVAAAQAQRRQVAATLAQQQASLQDAQIRLATLNNQRAAFEAYQREQARIAAERRRQAELARQRAEAAARAAAAAAAAAANNGGGGSGGGGGGGGGSYVPPGPAGNWTPAAGQRAVHRAMQWLGTMYAWAGGNANGPTYGVCAGDGAFNDCNIVGFDCSGLVMYAWAQYPFAHYAATQFTQGSVHPNRASLMPGDLVFWSSDGTIAGIHHVAIYIGNGNVVQAPQSGSVIQVTPIDQVSYGYFGATRPLT